MLLATGQWRGQHPEVAEPGWRHKELMTSAGMSWVYGQDRRGRPVWHVRARLHDPGQSTAVISLTFSVLEWIIQLMVPPVQSCTVMLLHREVIRLQPQDQQ
eukprot:SAG31_NODE_3847_length_3819_cov_1.762366_2_plen_101_part_00